MAIAATIAVDLIAKTEQFTSAMDSTASRLTEMGRQAKDMGKNLSTYVTLPVVGVAAAALKMGGDFQSGMNMVRAVTGATGDDFEALSNQAKELGRTTEFSASQSAEAMYFLASAGFDTNQVLSAMPSVLQLASAAQMDLGQAADITSNILSGYGMEVSELGKVNDVLVRTFQLSNTNLQQLGEAFKYAGPLATAAGVEFEEAAAILGTMGNAGIQASMAGTSLRGAITRLLSPTESVNQVMSQLGIQVRDSAGDMLPMIDIIQQLEDSGASAEQMMALFGARAGPAMQAVVSQGTGSLRELVEQLRESGGTAEAVAKTQMEGFNGAMKAMKSAFEGVMIAIAEAGLIEWAQSFAERLTALIQKVAELNPNILKVATIVALLAAAVGPLILAFVKFTEVFAAVAKFLPLVSGAMKGLVGVITSSVIPAVKSLFALLVANPIGIVVVALAALAAAFVYVYQRSETFREIVSKIIAPIAQFASSVRDKLVAALVVLAEKIGPVSEAAQSMRSTFGGVLDYLRDKFGSVFSWILDFVGKVVYQWLRGIGLVVEVYKLLGEWVLWAWDRLKTFGATVASLVGIMVDAGRAVRDWLGQAVLWLGGVFTSVFGGMTQSVRGFVGDVLVWMANAFTNILGSVTDTVTGFVSGVLGFLGRILPDGVRESMDSFANNMTSRARSAVDTTKQIVSELASAQFEADVALDVQSNLNDVVSDINNAFAGLGESFGVNVIDPLSEGTKAAVESTAEFYKALVEGARLGTLNNMEVAALTARQSELRYELERGNLPLARRNELVRELNTVTEAATKANRENVGELQTSSIRIGIMSRELATVSDTIGRADVVQREASQALGVMGSAAASVGEKMRGAFTGAIGNVIGSLNPMGAVAKALAQVMKELAPFVEALEAPMKILGEVIAKALLPIIEALFPVFKFVAIIATYLGQVLFTVAGGIQTVVGGVIKAIGTLISKIPGLGGVGRGIAGAGQSMMDVGAGFREAAKGLGEAREAIKALEWPNGESAIKDTTDAVERTGIGIVDAINGSEPFTRPPGGLDGYVRPGMGGDPDPFTPPIDITINVNGAGDPGTVASRVVEAIDRALGETTLRETRLDGTMVAL